MKNEERVRCLNELSQIITSNQFGFDEMNKKSHEFFSKYINILHIGKIEIVTNIPKSIYDQQLKKSKIIAYSNNSFSDEFIEKTNVIANKGSSNILIYPIKEYKFKDEEIEFIFSIVSLFQLYFSKKRLENIIEETRYRDSLTNLLNLEGLYKFTNQINNEDKYVYVFSNIKNFKYINTIFDRADADIILKKYSKELTLMLDCDEALCRPGGDNFISLIKKNNLKKYIKKLEHIIIEFNNKEVELYSTIGYYENKKYLPANISIEFATNAYVVAKRKNVSIFEYTDELNKKMIREKTIMVEIKEAMKNEELINYYQPKVNCNNNELCGAEALVRWNKKGKIVLPIEFIEILEKENKIIDLDYYVLIKTCKDIKKWQELGLKPVKISVNFSMKHLDYSDTVKKIMKIIKKFDIDPKYIEIELTEITNIEDISKMEKFIKTLQENNISVSMDDFGSGYSSITLLKNLNYDIVKIDKALIDSLEKDNKKNLIILRNIITMLKELEIDVIAEGVESKKQLNILKEYGCKKIQGYYFDKPLEEKDFVKRLENIKYKK